MVVGFAALVLGALVYITDRAPGSVYFIPDGLEHFFMPFTNLFLFGPLADHLPSFTHTSAFSLMTLGIMSPGHGKAGLICLCWFVTDTLFEIGQAFPETAAAGCPSWFRGVPFLENTGSFFKNGTFDPWDIVSFSAGALAALAVYRVMTKKDAGHEFSYEKNH